MNEIKIPRYIDSQPQLFFWELDEALVFFGCMSVGVAIGGWGLLILMALGYFAVGQFKRFKNGQMPGILQHLTYSVGLMELNKIYRNGLLKIFIL